MCLPEFPDVDHLDLVGILKDAKQDTQGGLEVDAQTLGTGLAKDLGSLRQLLIQFVGSPGDGVTAGRVEP
jgi:hypothetical protein